MASGIDLPLLKDMMKALERGGMAPARAFEIFAKFDRDNYWYIQMLRTTIENSNSLGSEEQTKEFHADVERIMARLHGNACRCGYHGLFSV